MEEKKSKNKSTKKQPNNPLHGVKLTELLEVLVAKYGW
ncbi:MAG: VF530 family DNA-binding protein, partial [Flavobacteriaceae bacterium]|nr:VF530 family DNA-binding protein [Flavobacteriaceae bacterium]